jgi:hypothetical protein
MGLRSRPMRSLVTSGLRVLVMLAAVGCGDDTVHAATEGATEDTTSSRTDSSGSSDGGEASDGSSDDDSGTDTGEPAVPGHSTSQTVSSGHRISSRRFTMVYTLGQSTSLSATHVSPNYTIQGGLIGASASSP